jgi:hypothetical protein
MNEKPLERLNYFNGQRLQAADFKLEQEYHMRVRRWLNRSLYTPGIASGLQVYKIEGKSKVKVLPGLAIDHLGREIILLEEQTVDVVGPGGGSGPCKGPYLTIRYQEEVIAQQDASCAVGGSSANTVAWGGPARILAEPVLELNAELPHEGSGKIALACLTLTTDCGSVETVDSSVRRIVKEVSAAKVRQYALEGVREVAAIPIEKGSPLLVKGTVLFHIKGGQPNSVTLYLKLREFSKLHYTELGWHTHGAHVTGSIGPANPPLTTTQTGHSHSAGMLAIEPSGEHPHDLQALTAEIPPLNLKDFDPYRTDDNNKALVLVNQRWAVDMIYEGQSGNYHRLWEEKGTAVPSTRTEISFAVLGSVPGTTITGGSHPHSIGGTTAPGGGFDYSHCHDLLNSGSTIDFSGAVDTNNPAVVARKEGKPLTYVHDLQIAIDGSDKSTAIREQISDSVGADDPGAWTVLGDRTGNHPLADDHKDAIAIRLDYLPGVRLEEGEHSIEFSVGLMPNGEANGGRIHFNLYVE